MNLPDKDLMDKVCWTTRYIKRLEKLADKLDEQWTKEAYKEWGSKKHQLLTEKKRRVRERMRLIVRYSSILTSKAIAQMN